VTSTAFFETGLPSHGIVVAMGLRIRGSSSNGLNRQRWIEPYHSSRPGAERCIPSGSKRSDGLVSRERCSGGCRDIPMRQRLVIL
jgi:hypothetical protein